MARKSSETPKQFPFAQFAAVAKALAHPHRLALLEQLALGERGVEVLAGRIQVSIANASQHLQHMRQSGIVTARRAGKFVFYQLADESVLELPGAIRRVAERNLAEVDRVVRDYFHQRDGMEPVSRGELVERMKLGLVTLLDVRPADEFALGHLPGARNMPLAELKRHLARLDKSKEIVAYCRGPYCVLSYEAVALLRARGFRVRRLEDGVPPAFRSTPSSPTRARRTIGGPSSASGRWRRCPSPTVHSMPPSACSPCRSSTLPTGPSARWRG